MTSNQAGIPPREPPPHQVEATEAPSSIAAVAFFFDQCRAQLERQMQDVDAMDAKTIAVATAGTLLLAVVPGTRFAAHDSIAAALTTPTLVVLGLSMGCYILVLLATGIALLTREFHVPPAPRDIYETYLRIESELSKLAIAMDMMAAYEENKEKIGRKQWAMFGGLVFVALGIARAGGRPDRSLTSDDAGLLAQVLATARDVALIDHVVGAGELLRRDDGGEAVRPSDASLLEHPLELAEHLRPLRRRHCVALEGGRHGSPPALGLS